MPNHTRVIREQNINIKKIINNKKKCFTCHVVLCTASRRKLPTCFQLQDPGRTSVPEGAFSPGSVPQVTTKPTVSLRFPQPDLKM